MFAGPRCGPCRPAQRPGKATPSVTVGSLMRAASLEAVQGLPGRQFLARTRQIVSGLLPALTVNVRR